MSSENDSPSDPDQHPARDLDGDPCEPIPITAVPSAESQSATTDLVTWDGAEITTARHYADASRAPATQRAYASDWQRFDQRCIARALDTLPADPRAVAMFLAAEAAAGAAAVTIGRRLAAIGWMHRRAGSQPPQAREGAAVILEVVAGIRRSHGVAPVRKQAADTDVLRDMLRAIPGEDLRSVRYRAVLPVGMAGVFRRSELVALRWADLERVPEGLRITIRRGKTDQEGAGVTIAIPEGRRLRPKALLEEWIARGGIADGLLFRRLTAAGSVTPAPMSDRAIARLMQARAAAVGYGAADFAGHSAAGGVSDRRCPLRCLGVQDA